ncbi:saccharopine dehydrogenase family protein [Phenylobacterium montanum]|uniref:Saccharopine dehydrogenase NADP-binding domain-containing protein n=1 Tax=Phenylobacterium montanum TaxID=2823693 RepID=A0A975FZL5_9CAUL|nr:saccharopine dehydrogenase NADP-binding domain-containing protein [Caulobacter sp. S6]QUD87864.1 saccharopine dehydrogenase NADP-binding domain-containing protein [Caulobacter sp. S6]
MSGAKEFDAIAFGSTGYTGRLVADYLLKTYGAGGAVKWAMAGRSQAKLEEVRSLIGGPESLPLVVADANDAAALEAMTRRTKVVISTAGPYQLYGSGLVAACAKTGCDYVDLTGESHWIAEMTAKHQDEAKASGARLVFSCGFDSIPFDMGVWFAEEEAKKRFGAYAPRVRGRLRAMKGGLSGGTLASGMATMAAAQQDPSIGKLLADPFALTPGFTGADQPDGETPYEDEATGTWVGPFMMASINTKAVHRTNFLLGYPWGRDFRYDEMQMLDGPPAAPSPFGGFSFGAAGMPKPGEGPTEEERETGFYDILYIAETADGRRLRCAVKGDRDPGYGSTSKILAEAGLALALDTPREVTPGGCWTPASAMAAALMQRMPQAGLTFEVEG